MDPENIIPGALPDGSQLNPPDAAGTVGSVPVPVGTPAATVEALTLAEINASLGKQFPTKDAAIKAFKDTFSYVGKKKEDIEKEIRGTIQSDDRISKLAQELEIERKERFYDRNPQYADPSVRTIIDKFGGNPAEVVNNDSFKAIFEKVSGYDKSVKLRTVLESNPRITASRDSLTKAREIRQQNNGNVTHEVQKLAVDAVMDAYDLKK